MKKYIALFLTLFLAVAATSAREVYSLNNDWKFFFQVENSSDQARTIRLPHTWNIGIDNSSAYSQTVANYERNLSIPSSWQGKRLFLRFYGVQNVASVLLNGTPIGEHRGAYTAFTIEITDKIIYGADNTLLVVVSNTWRTDTLPLANEEQNFGGIYRDVELIITDPTAINPTFHGTDGVIIRPTTITKERVEGEVELHYIGSKGGSANVTIDIADPEGYVTYSGTTKVKTDGKVCKVGFTLDNPHLWSPKNPNIYSVRAIIATDTVQINTGFRKIAVSADSKFTIDSKRVDIHGVCMPHTNSIHGNALTSADIVSDITLIKSMGANAIRSLTGPHSQFFYNICDRQGLFVWIDIPFVGTPFRSDIPYFSTIALEQNGLEQATDIVYQNINHPSVAFWGVFSLLKGRTEKLLNYIRTINTECKKIDSSRPTIACSNQDGDINFITDLIVWRQNLGWDSGSVDDICVWQDGLRKNWNHLCQAICYGEGGVVGSATDALASVAINSEKGTTKHNPTRYHEGYISMIDNSLFWGVWVNSMFDYSAPRYRGGVRTSGIVKADHKELKDIFYLYRTLWNTKSHTLHIVGKNRTIRAAENQLFRIYSSQAEPQLFLNDSLINLQIVSQGVYRTDTLKLSGRNKIKAVAGDLSDSTYITIGNYLRVQ